MRSLLEQPWWLAFLAVALGVLVGLAGTWGWRTYRAYRERQRRAARLHRISLALVRDVFLPDGTGSGLHVDYLLLTTRGLVILDLRDVVGNVFGSDSMTEWTVMTGSRRFTFANPQGAMYDRLAALRAIAGEVPVDGRIVFGPQSLFPKGMPRMTLREESLEAEFPQGDRAAAERMVEPWREVWATLSSSLPPSSFPKRN
ncbi:MAG: hypothetical protein EBZ91_10445 [Gammaproteobacteria bacterium]|jgi:hypothetical protein|nr:hypothetical protein [Gammaproteobacteria bacterium]